MATTKKNLLMEEGQRLAEGKWKKYITGLTEGYKRKHNGAMPPANIISTTAIMLENTQKMINRMDETTRVVNLGNFVDYGFGVITAVMPSLVANEVVSVQPLKGRSGEVFYLDFKYGSNKGKIKKGQDMISSIRGANTDTTYSSEIVEGEELMTLTTGSTTAEFSLSYTPLRPGTIEISCGDFDLVDDGKGQFKVSSGTAVLKASSIDYNSGNASFELTSGAPTSDVVLAAGYQFDYGNMDVNGTIPTADIDLVSKTITTTTRSLAARWLFDAAFELQSVHGISADEEISAAMAAEVRHGIDGEILNDLRLKAMAGGKTYTWSKTAPHGVSYTDYKDTFVDLMIEMSNAIFGDTMRAQGNFIICGIDVSSLVESIPGRFVPTNDGLKAGPHVVGTLDGRWKVIKNPFYPANEFVVGYKGQSYLEGGYVYAPFLPLFTTPTTMLEDFVNRKGVRTTYGKKMLNPYFYAKGELTA